MRIRTQIILAAFVLAVVPLAAIVTYSYHSSRRALESAYQRESARLTRQMDRRLAAIRAELDQRLAVVSALPLPTTANPDEGNNIVTVMGDAASFVDALEFQPLRDPHPQIAARREPREARARDQRSATQVAADPDDDPDPDVEAPDEDRDVPEVAEAPPAVPAVAAVAPAAPPAPDVHVVIDIPSFPAVSHYVMSEEQKELIAEIGRLGSSLGNQDLSAEEREDLRKELTVTQNELRRVVTLERTKSQRELRETIRIARAQQKQAVRDAQRAHDVPPVAPVAPVPAPAATPNVAPLVKPKPASKVPSVQVREATMKDIEKATETAKKASLIFGQRFQVPVRKEGELVGQITARISPEQVVRRVLGGATEEGTEIPFALDREGTIYTRNSEERSTLEKLGIPERIRKGESLKSIEGWIVTTSTDPQSGLRIGVARPVGENLDELRRTAGRNLALGMGLIAFALIGIVPLSNHLTRDVKLVTEGAERIAQGDLMTRLPVKTKNELGQLARSFNRMAEDLSRQQQRLVEQERARKEQELQQRLMSVEYERKSVELEEARRFQLSMLPKEVPQHAGYDVAVYTRTATEVGGDYYDFHLAGDVLSVTIGDATGHGAKAGTMVTVIKTLFSAYSGTASPSAFLGDAAEKIKRMDLGRMAMALSLGRFDRRMLTLSSAGMPPVLVHRVATSRVEELALSATPLGTLGTAYQELTTQLESGDTALFLTDGFPELMNDEGQQVGYAAALDAFAEAAREATAAGVIESLASFAARWHGDAPPNDDVTFVIVRVA